MENNKDSSRHRQGEYPTNSARYSLSELVLNVNTIEPVNYTLKLFLEDLDKLYPFKDAARWDNVGVLLESSRYPNRNVRPGSNLYYALDVTMDVLDEVDQGGVLVTHHPLIFSGIKSLNQSTPNSRIIQECIRKDLTVIALHTNYDYHFLNRNYLEYEMGLTINKQSESLVIHEFEKGIKFNDFLSTQVDVMEMLGYKRQVTFVGDEDKIVSKIAVCTGSGGSTLTECAKEGVDVLLTGDISYHTAIDANTLGINLIDITHFYSERMFGKDLLQIFGGRKVSQKNPFHLAQL